MTNAPRLPIIAAAILIAVALDPSEADGVTEKKQGQGGGWVKKNLFTP